MNNEKDNFPAGWDESRVRKVLDHYESQGEDEAVAEDEVAFKNSTIVGVQPLPE